MPCLSRSPSQRRVGNRPFGAALRHQEPDRGQPHPPRQPWPGLPGEHPSVRSRVVGSALGVCPQRPIAGSKAATAAFLPPHRQYRQRTRLLLAAGPHPCPISPTAASASGAMALHPRLGWGIEPARGLQFPAERRQLPVRSLQHTTVMADPAGAVRQSLSDGRRHDGGFPGGNHA